MMTKKVLRFYFKADKLNLAMDRVIFKCASDFNGGIENFDTVVDLIDKKEHLGNLWQYVNGVVVDFNPEERKALQEYATARGGMSKLAPDKKKMTNKLLARFVRHARALYRYDEELALLAAYYCLL